MYGAIIGDIIGSRFEFDNGSKSREFQLFTKDCEFTDDTVMTIAVAEALMDAGPDACEEEVKAHLIRSMKKWGKAYPHAGYGARFIRWVLTEDAKPYGSYGNGSAMRVSSAGWLYDSIERTREVARWTAEVTHNHPEGVKGAESLAAAIFMARNGASLSDIEMFLIEEFGYDLSRTLDDIRPVYYHVEDCMRTMPEAYTCFLESDNFESTIRNVMYIGGDTDTLGAIAGALAEAFWGIPLGMVDAASDYLSDDLFEVIDRFRNTIHFNLPEGVDDYKNNLPIKKTLERLNETHNQEELITLALKLVERIREEGQAPTPMEDVNNLIGTLDPGEIVVGKEYKLEKEFRLRVYTLTDKEGRRWIPFFTDEEEYYKQETTSIMLNVPIRILIEDGLYTRDIEGMVINPFSDNILLDKDFLGIVMKRAGGEQC